jgi:O-acetylhomoserine (thiol)-lyase
MAADFTTQTIETGDHMRIETLAVHAGYTPDPTTKAAAVPIYQTVAYAFDNAQHGADLFDLKVAGNIYTRIMNPTQDVLEKRVAALEGGVAALAVASGMAAITYAIQTIAEAGDNFISASQLYGGTYNLFAHTLPQIGIEVRFADARQPETFAALIDARTKAIFCESIGNPLGNVTDVAKLAEIAHAHGIPLIVDNTVPSPYLFRPIEHGADIVVHSLTKYLGGHGTTVGGAIVDSGKFPWAEHKERFKRLNEPDVSYHGVVYTEAFGPAAFIGRARVVPLRNMGAAISPLSAFQLIQGIETLALRMDRICDNTLALAKHLKQHPKVAWVNYAGLEDHPDHALVKKYMNGRASGILSFGLKLASGEDPRAAGARVLDALQLFTRLVNIGDAKSLATHPASTTHRQLNPEELAKAGVSEDMLRLSVGIEHIDDLREDLEQALNAA